MAVENSSAILTIPTHLLATSVPNKSCIPWNRDAEDGPQHPKHSKSILIDWLTTQLHSRYHCVTGYGGLNKI